MLDGKATNKIIDTFDDDDVRKQLFLKVIGRNPCKKDLEQHETTTISDCKPFKLKEKIERLETTSYDATEDE